MTQQELDALPDISIKFGVREEEKDGKRVRQVVLDETGFIGALWRNDDDPISVVDTYGIRWMIGRTPDGVLSKRRSFGGP